MTPRLIKSGPVLVFVAFETIAMHYASSDARALTVIG